MSRTRCGTKAQATGPGMDEKKDGHKSNPPLKLKRPKISAIYATKLWKSCVTPMALHES